MTFEHPFSVPDRPEDFYLRELDRLAEIAMQGLCFAAADVPKASIAVHAYDVAEAMLAEKKRRGQAEVAKNINRESINS